VASFGISKREETMFSLGILEFWWLSMRQKPHSPFGSLTQLLNQGGALSCLSDKFSCTTCIVSSQWPKFLLYAPQMNLWLFLSKQIWKA
jgi:hypothetical protein